MMKKVFLTMVVGVFVAFGVFCTIFYHLGRIDAFEDIIGEKCWLDKQTRDVNCIAYIGK